LSCFSPNRAASSRVLNLSPSASTTDSIVEPTRTGTSGAFPADPETTTTFTSNPVAPQPVVNVIDINGDFPTGNNCTIIELVGNQNSIFVFRKHQIVNFGPNSGNTSHCGVQLVLKGIDANNVFWAVNSNLMWNEVAPALNRRHKMVGTFITDSTGNPKWQSVTLSGRLLGSNGVPNFTNTRIYAIANGQPSLVPVYRFSPEGPPMLAAA